VCSLLYETEPSDAGNPKQSLVRFGSAAFYDRTETKQSRVDRIGMASLVRLVPRHNVDEREKIPRLAATHPTEVGHEQNYRREEMALSFAPD
jgi:hypothetical protein